MFEGPTGRFAVRRAPRGFLEEAGVEGKVGSKVLVSVDEAKLLRPKMRVEVDERKSTTGRRNVRLAASHEPSPAMAVQVASLIEERDGVDERNVHVVRFAFDEESNVVIEGNFGDEVRGRHVAPGLCVVTARVVEVEASAVEGGVHGVKEPDNREQEHDVGQGVAREGATREQDGAQRQAGMWR